LEMDRSKPARKSAIEADMDRVISELLDSANVKRATKILRMSDSETRHEYEIRINPATNQPEVMETVASTKQECAICGRPFAQTFVCSRCKAKVCREHYVSEYDMIIDSCANCARDYARSCGLDYSNHKP